MQALKPTEFYATVTWMGRVIDSGDTLRSEALTQATFGFGGIEGECHGGLTRPSCTRTRLQHPKGTEIRNVRQLTILSVEEIAEIQSEMGLDRFDPAWMGASLVLEGIPDFSHIPPSSRLQGPSGVSLIVDMENRPCVLPGRVIDEDAPGHGPKFKRAAEGRRGVTGSVERPGPLAVGEQMRLHIPDQPVWSKLAQARAS